MNTTTTPPSPKGAEAKVSHTPGRWTTFTENGVIDIIGPNGWHIASIDGDTELDEANAKLIAASPALLEACEAVVAYVGGGHDFVGAVGKCRSALHLATGGQP